MSVFQNNMVKIIAETIQRDRNLNLEEGSYYLTEKPCKKEGAVTPYQFGREDMYLHLVVNGVEKEVCIEIKSGLEDLKSGYGLNFVEDYNFIAFEQGHGYSRIRKKHLDCIPEYVGILVVIDGEVYTYREARPKGTGLWPGAYFSIGFGKTAKDLIEEIIDGKLRVA